MPNRIIHGAEANGCVCSLCSQDYFSNLFMVGRDNHVPARRKKRLASISGCVFERRGQTDPVILTPL